MKSKNRIIARDVKKFEKNYLEMPFNKALLKSKLLSASLYLIRGVLDLAGMRQEMEDCKSHYLSNTRVYLYEDYTNRIEYILDKYLKGAREK